MWKIWSVHRMECQWRQACPPQRLLWAVISPSAKTMHVPKILVWEFLRWTWKTSGRHQVPINAIRYIVPPVVKHVLHRSRLPKKPGPRPGQHHSFDLYRISIRRRAMNLSSRIDRVLSLSSPDGVAAFEQKSLEDMGNCRVSFGKAHMGKSFLEMWENEKHWVKWFVRTYANSQKEEHRKMIIYVEKMVQQASKGFHLWTPEPQQRDCAGTLQRNFQSQGGSGIGPQWPSGHHDRDERRSLRSVGCDGARAHGSPAESPPKQRPGAPEPRSLHRECPVRDSEPDSACVVRDPIEYLCMAGDIDHEFEEVNTHDIHMNHRQSKF